MSLFKKKSVSFSKETERYQEFHRCPNEGCGRFFRSYAEAALHYLKTTHCEDCGFGSNDPYSRPSVLRYCVACDVMKSPYSGQNRRKFV
jgi:uncharacterized protein (DUF983 family)